jgi:hypothetical protein
MLLIGRGRYARETYPVGGQGAALTALANRYLISPSGPVAPDAFTATAPAIHTVAAVNVVRRASGIFVVMVQLPTLLAGADVENFEATAFLGSTASGGTANGQWLVAAGAPVSLTASSGVSPMGVWITSVDSTTLSQTPTLVGVNARPVPQGSSAIVIQGNTLGATQVTPGGFFAVAYELP